MMGKFSEGQYVRVLHTDYKDEFPVGSVFKVGESYSHGVEPEGEHAGLFFLNGEIEPWQPRVGERVKVNFAGWEGEGEVTAEEYYGILLVTMKTGTYAGREGGFLARDIEPILTTTPEQPTLKIEAGKFYKTRDGRKVGPMSVDVYDLWSAPGFSSKEWYGNGRCYSDLSRTTPKDIIAEWIDEPAVEPKASNDNAGPKFKVGDRVELARSFYGAAKAGATGMVGERGMFDGYVDIVWDKNSPYQGQMDGGYSPDYFELLPPTPTTTIVALIENGQPKPSSTPHVHASIGAAEKEAKRLAAKFKGKQFGVFTLTTTHEEAAPVYDHKWQNMAAMGLKIDAIKELRAVAGIDLLTAKRAVEAFDAAA